jgi:TPP-dependent pyruvate/acetoin dehydrogenase alpha subunit
LEAVSEYTSNAREGAGPALLECMTYRWGGQTLRDPDKIRPASEKQAALRNDPVEHYKSRLLADGLLDESAFDEMLGEVRRGIGEAESKARALPSLEDLVRDSGIDVTGGLQ